MNIDISQFGKGAVPAPKEIRDLHYRLAATPALVDWSQPYKVPQTVPVLNQGSSSSCTAHATAAYCAALSQIEQSKQEDYSRRFIYSQSLIGPGQGAYIWKAMAVPITVGLAPESAVPDGLDEKTESDSTLNATAPIEARADKYAVIPRSNIDQLAQVIRDYGGFVTGFNGWNGMFSSDGSIVDWSKSDWGHCVYVYGYEMRSGKKYLRFRNSWSDGWGSDGDGFIPEEFVNSGMMFDCYTYAAIEDLDPSSMKLQLASDPRTGGKVYAIIENPKVKMWIPNPQTLQTGNQANLWGSFPDIVQKDLSGYTEGVIQISISQ